MSDFRGARGSNTGDDFHELWAARHAIRLLDDRDPLQALTVEGIAPVDEASAAQATWDGVDCALYEGGRNASEADRILLEQLKYSAADPKGSWTVSRLTRGDKREDSVLNRLAKAWAGIQALKPKGPVDVSLVSNQPIAPALKSAMATLAVTSTPLPRARPLKTATDETKLAFAAGLSRKNLSAFAGTLTLNGGAGSRFAIETELLADMTGWTDLELQTAVADLRQFIRQRMRPEFAGEIITKETVLLHLGVSSMGALFPCPPILKGVANPIPRASVAEAAARILAGQQRTCLHGRGGIGKTTALQQIEAALPGHSVMVTFDCYGGGTYMDAAALRHRPVDAFLQLSNEVASRLRLPILLGRHQVADSARLFWNRLRHAAQAHGAEHPDALIVIAVDAADNAVTAAAMRKPPEPCFVHDFIALGDLPPNVRFVVTARTGRLPEIALSPSFACMAIEPFTREETEAHVRANWDAPAEWLDLFHQLTAGVPRVQAYAMDLGGAPPRSAIERLLPGGRSLDQVFREQFERALGKSGNPSDLANFCAALIALPRPVPLADICGVLELPEAAVVDICADMAPAIRLSDGAVSFADEDFEHFVREEGDTALEALTRRAASWMLVRNEIDPYAAQHVAGVLVAVDRGAELLDLVEREPSPSVIKDPLERREAELARLRFAISVCRKAGDAARAMRFVLIGGEGLRTERALRALLCDNPDLAVRFAPDTAGRLILTDPEQIGFHGGFLLHKQVIDASVGNQVSLHEGARLISAWMAARRERSAEQSYGPWRLEVTDIAASVETALRAHGPDRALESLWNWTPKRLRLLVAHELVPRLIAQGDADLVQAVLDTGKLKPWEEIFLLVPMAIGRKPVDFARIAQGLAGLRKRSLNISRFLQHRSSSLDVQYLVVETAMAACELLARDAAASDLVDDFLKEILVPANRRIADHSPSGAASLDLLIRAHALQSVRAGKIPEVANLFVPRPEPVDESDRNRRVYEEEARDRKLNALAVSIFPTYAATAAGLAGSAAPAEVEEFLAQEAKRREGDSWSILRQGGGSALAMAAARAMLLLMVSDVDIEVLTKVARRVHGRWDAGGLAPDIAFAQRMALRAETHDSLLADIDRAASEIRGRRIGAEDKSKTLVAYARLLLPISPADANAVFNDAVDAASQLDREIIAQLRLLAQLFDRGRDRVAERRSAARDLSEVLADAAIRLDGEADLPWGEVMGILGVLDLPLALANAAKWDDADLAGLRHTLAPILKAGLSTGQLDPAASMALELFLDGDHGVIEAALDHLGKDPTPGAFLEEAAWDALIRHNHRDNHILAERGAAAKTIGPWGMALGERQAFVAGLPKTEPDPPGGKRIASSRSGPPRPVWTRETLLDAKSFEKSLTDTLAAAHAGKHYISASDVVDWAAQSVDVRDRIEFLNVLREIRGQSSRQMPEKMLELLERWNSPAIRKWATSEFPEVIAARLADFVRYIAHGETRLIDAVKLTGLDSHAVADLLLRGIELHGQTLAGDQVFALAALIADYIDPGAAAGTGVWYARRLAERIELEDSDQNWLPGEMPTSVQVAVARFLYAFLGDYDVRVRWRAAQAVRRLARLGAANPMEALIDEYGRVEEPVFRSPRLDFYWLAARLWFTVAWERIVSEAPELGGLAGVRLLAIARDEDFPHLIVRSFARDACLKLAANGHIELDSLALAELAAVGKSALPDEPALESFPRGPARPYDDLELRFHFDSMDTVPYWYDPLVSVFADISQKLLLATAEKWIIDCWGYSGDIHVYDKEKRRHRFSERDWSLTSNRQGSKPTLERLNNHLEWHALWCAVGELLKTKPLATTDPMAWDGLPRLMERQMLTEPQHWSSDLRRPVPLRDDFWQVSKSELSDWVETVPEGRLRRELMPADRPGYILVGGAWRIGSYDRVETVACSSTLVEPDLAAALVRTLQTMDSAWDYRLPQERSDEDGFDPELAPYQMIPWLRTSSSDGGLDDLDPLRGAATLIDWMPSQRVVEACGLKRFVGEGVFWSAADLPPMFRYEVWGESDRDDNRYSREIAVSGRRLLVERSQLMTFLQLEERELVIEVEVRREGRDNRRSYDAEDQTPEAAYDRVYRLDGEGALHAAEGRVGTWAGDRTSA